MLTRGLGLALFSQLLVMQIAASSSWAGTISPPVIEVDSALEYLDLNEKAQFYEEQESRLTPDEATTRYLAGAFKGGHSPHRNYGRRGNPFWFYMELDVAETALTHQWILELDYTFIEAFDIYLKAPGDKWSQVFSKATVSESVRRDIELNAAYTHVIPFSEIGKYKVLLRVKTAGVSLVPLNLWRADQWHLSVIDRNVFLSLFYGAFIVMLLYNFMLYIGTKFNVYLIYCAYLVTIMCYLSLGDGFLERFISINSEDMFRALSVGSSIISTMMVGFFAIAFLQTKERFPIKHKLIQVMLGILVCLAFINVFISTDIASNSVIALVPIYATLLFATTVHALINGYKEARLFFLGWAVMFFSSIYTSFGMMGYIDYEFTLEYALHIGSAVEVIFLSLALADRINTFKAEKEKAEATAKRELLNKNELLKESNRVKDEFIATVSHELRTPLNGIIGAIELARGEGVLQQRARFDDLAIESSYRMNSIVDNMLVFSELLTGKPQLQNEPMEVRGWFEDLTKDLKKSATDKGLGFNALVADSVPFYATADSKKLGLILVHLIDNAVKFTQAGQVTVSLDYVDEQLVIKVSDSGCGIEVKDQAYVFESFRQVDGSYSRNYGGLGIGLAIVSQLLKLLEGEVYVKSEIKKGSDFIVRLPLQAVSNIDISCDDLSEETVGNAQFHNRVLVVEDNPVNQKVLCAILKKLGCEVHSAYNGVEALSECRENTFDIIFMDCQMPEMNGFEATLRIRQMDSGNKEIPIIAVTANATEADMEHCFKVGMNDFVKKPINKKAIVLQMIHRLKKAA